MTPAATLDDARAAYGPVEVLHGVTMVFPAGSLVALVGRNGAGKTSTLRCLAGLLPLRSGRVRSIDRELTGLSPYARSAAGVTMVPDERGVFPDLTVGENLALFAGHGPPDAALSVFPALAGRMRQRAGTLSGGEQQMVALSRAFLRPGRLLLLDEVSRGLSPAVTARCYEALAGLVSPQRSIVVVEQYLSDVLRVADLVYVLARGQVAFAGEPAELTRTGRSGRRQGV
jgi:branched-chain amino acid transport system ATP-binding protein